MLFGLYTKLRRRRSGAVALVDLLASAAVLQLAVPGSTEQRA